MAKRKWKDLSNIEKGGIIIGGGTILYFLYRGVTGLGNVKQAPVDYGQIPTVYDVNGQGVKWDPDPLAKEIFENLEGYNFFTYPETTDKIRQLQPEQIKLLYNHYNTYYAKDFPTLTRLIDNELPDWEGSYQKTVSKLKSLGLNENAWGNRMQIQPKVSPGYIALMDCGYL